MNRERVEPEARWLGSGRLWISLTVLIAAGWGAALLGGVYMAHRKASPQEAFIYGQKELTPGAAGAYRVLVRNAATGKTVAGATVNARLLRPDGATAWSGSSATDGEGFAAVEPALAADAAAGSYKLVVDASSGHGSSAVSETVTVKRSFRVMVTTDKPVYQPGQVIHLRALALATFDLHPVAGADAVLEVKDAKGNKVFKHKAKTSAYGIVAADFTLADQVNTGSYSAVATVGDTTSERAVTVDRYVLPKYKVEITTERTFYLPGELLRGEVTARYTFGEPVGRARVRVAASELLDTFREFAAVEGETNQEGRFAFEIPLKEAFAGVALKKGDALVSLAATVVDRANQKQSRTLELPVSASPLRVELLPESGALVPRVDNIVWVVTSYPDGRPAQARVRVAGGESIETSPAGIGALHVTPPNGGIDLTVEAEDRQGARASMTTHLAATQAADALLLRTDRAVYLAGSTVQATVLSTASGRVFIDVVKDARTVLTRGLDIAGGAATLSLDLPPDLFGTLELRAYRILPSGDIGGDCRIIQVNPPAGLHIAVSFDKATYRPGETALLRFAVTGRDGRGTAAALGVSGVDEAVFALQEMRPGLERVYFMLQEEILKPRYEIHATLPVDDGRLVTPALPSPDADRATAVLFSAASAQRLPARAASATFREKQESLTRASQRYRQRLITAALLSPLGLLLLLALPFAAYLGGRLVRRGAVEGADETDRRALRRTIGAVWWRFVLGLYLPAAVVIGVAYAFDGMPGHEPRPALIIALVGLTMATMLLLQVLAVRRLRRLPAAEELPFARRLAVLVPLAQLLAPMGVACMVASSRFGVGLEGRIVTVALVATAAAVLLVVAALGVARACAVRSLSVGRYVAVAVGRPLAVAAPALLVVGLTLHNRVVPVGAPEVAFGGGPIGRMQALDGAIRREAVAMAVPMAAPMVKGAKLEDKNEAATGGLKEPARVRRFFPETLLWSPELITDPDGSAELKVPLADSITTWRVAGSAVSARGELGAFSSPLRVFQDFFVDLDLPVALTQHDEVSVPVAVYNYLPVAQTVELELAPGDWFTLDDAARKTVRLGPKEVGGTFFRVRAATPGRHALTVKARGTEMADAVERTVAVSPDGDEVVETVNGTLSKPVRHTLTIPADAIAGASDLYVKVYPGAFSQVVEGLDGLLRMPSGCFEQTSSSTYPNVLVLGYLRASHQVKPEIEMKALQYINLGYQRLLSFEVPGGGFSWFGQPPAHDVLTAYGVIEFADMARVYDIDPAVLARTAEWLYGQQQGDGSWHPTEGGIAEGAINQYQGQVLRTTAYVAWSIGEAGKGDARLGRALGFIKEKVAGESDPYTLAVCANALAVANDSGARAVIDRLVDLKQTADDGVFWHSTGESATFSRGDVLDIETTAIAAQALIKAGQDVSIAHKALAWLVKHKDAFGTWSSTQATVQAMRALLAGSAPGAAIEAPVDVDVIANGATVQRLHITPDTSDVFRLVSLREQVRPGDNTVALETAGAGNLAYSIVAVHYVPRTHARPEREKELSIDVAYDSTTLKKDDTLTSTVTVRYNRPGEARMTIVDLGVPPGFDVVPEGLDALRSSGVIARYSLTGRQVILYFDRILGGQPVKFSYQLKAKFPVRAKTPPATVYQYYEPAVRDQAAPVEITVL